MLCSVTFFQLVLQGEQWPLLMALCSTGASTRGLLLRVLPQLLQRAAAAAPASPQLTAAMSRAFNSTDASTSGREQQQQGPAGAQEAAESLEEIRARVFGTHLGDNRRSGRKALLKPLKGKEFANWYFMMQGQNYPFLESETEIK